MARAGRRTSTVRSWSSADYNARILDDILRDYSNQYPDPVSRRSEIAAVSDDAVRRMAFTNPAVGDALAANLAAIRKQSRS